MSQPLCIPLQDTFRFLRPPIPARSTAFLAVCLPAILRRQPYGLTTFPACHTTDLGSAYSPAVSNDVTRDSSGSTNRNRLVSAYQQLWHRNANEVYQQFTYVNRISQPSSSTPLLLGVSGRSSRDARSPETSGGYIVGRASHPTVTSDACLPRLLLVVQQVHYTRRNYRRGRTMTHRAFARIT